MRLLLLLILNPILSPPVFRAPFTTESAPAKGHLVVTAPVEKRTVDKRLFEPAELDLHGSSAKLATGLRE